MNRSLLHFCSSRRLLTALILSGLLIQANCQDSTPAPPYRDLSHTSKVFGREKKYRLYLPAGYDRGDKRYPVVYYFHGWGGRYFKDDNARIAYEKLAPLVDKLQLILVMWDGNITEDNPRPYNVGNHGDIKDQVQMKDYFPELVSHIDSSYRTLTERSNRAVMGFSMGGYMAFFLAGKYPDKVCAAVDLTGSSEFFIGYPNDHTLYQLQYTFKNLRESRLLMHNSRDFISILNEQVYQSANWEGRLQLSYYQFEGGHRIDEPGETALFEKALLYIDNAFSHPIPKPRRWSHYDLYPSFQVWNYQVNSNKKEPGFIFLNNVSVSGFGNYTLKWLPAGPEIRGCTTDIVTAPLYPPNSPVNVVKYRDGQVARTILNTDEKGRLRIEHCLPGTELGFFTPGDAPDLVYVGHQLAANHRYLRVGENNPVRLTIFNRGGEFARPTELKLALVPLDTGTTVSNGPVSVMVKPGQRIIELPPFSVQTNMKAPGRLQPPWVKFRVKLSLGAANFEDEMMLPVFFDVPAVPIVTIDDGINIKDSALGSGNGDGAARAGEKIMVYIEGRRARLYTDDPYVETAEEKLVDEILPGTAGDGYTLSSVIRIARNCPPGHVIELLASYETKSLIPEEPIDRKLTWRKVFIKTRK
jgi:enterochelin esterase-like enzyme